MELSKIRPTAKQVAELDQKAADLAILGRVLGMFRSTLVEAGFGDDEAYTFAVRVFEASMFGPRPPDDDDN